MTNIIEIEHVCKNFKLGDTGSRFKRKSFKHVHALDNVSLDIKKNEIFSLLGPNGAGKTTLIKILSTLLLPDSGNVNIAGFDVLKSPNQIKKIIGVITGGGIRSNYWRLTGLENLIFFGRLYGLSAKVAKQRALELLELMDLKDKRDVKVESYSTGMKVKLSLARALIADPEILLLDEPTIGLDPSFSMFIRKFIKRELQQQQGKTILLTTHYMHEAEYLSNRVGLISNGKIISTETPHNFKKLLNYKEKLRITFSNSPFDIKTNLFDDLNIDYSSKHNLQENYFEFEIKDINNELFIILDYIKEKHLLPNTIEIVSPTLEDAFLQIINDTRNQPIRA